MRLHVKMLHIIGFAVVSKLKPRSSLLPHIECDAWKTIIGGNPLMFDDEYSNAIPLIVDRA